MLTSADRALIITFVVMCGTATLTNVVTLAIVILLLKGVL